MTLCPACHGDQGIQGDTGATGNGGATGPQGPQGETGNDGAAGTSRWTDNNPFNTVETTGSIKIGDDGLSCTSNTEGTIRYHNGAFEGCNVSNWLSLTGIYAIGNAGPAGGTVFYVTEDGRHGLEAAPVDQASGTYFMEWGCSGTSITGADGTAIWSGMQNTKDILDECNYVGIAVKAADEYSLGGYDDWFLPSKDELNLLYLQRNYVDLLNPYYYWSSTEDGSASAKFQHLGNGTQGSANKDSTFSVRAIRAF